MSLPAKCQVASLGSSDVRHRVKRFGSVYILDCRGLARLYDNVVIHDGSHVNCKSCLKIRQNR